MNYYSGLSEKEIWYIKEAKKIGSEKGDCKELSNLSKLAYADYRVGIISEKAYAKIYATCTDYACPR